MVRYSFGFVLGLLAVSASASDVSMRGFASVVGGQSLDSDEQIYGYEGELDFSNDSLAALQFNANLDDGLSATVQIMSRGRDGFDTRVEWAYVTYEFNDSVQLSAGRIRTPFYRYSDFVDVRYALPWVVVPQTVYGFEFPGYDGLSLFVKNTLGSWDSTVQVIFGQLEGDIPNSELTIDTENLTGFNWTLNRDWLTLRAGYVSSRSDLAVAEMESIAGLVASLGQATMTDTSALQSNLLVDGDRGVFINLAAGIDYQDWLVNVEFISYEIDDSLLNVTDSYYIMLGKRMGKFTPYVTVSNASGEPSDDVLSKVPAAIADIPIAQLGGANISQVIQGVIDASEVDTDVLMAGVRYDFHPSAAFKTEFLEQKDINGEKTALLRCSIDLVF